MNGLLAAIHPFSALTIALACAAAFAAGRAIAIAWRPMWLILFAAIPLGVVAPLLDFMLIGETDSVPVILISVVMTTLCAGIGFRWHRGRQLVRQYPWLSTPQA